MPKFVEGGIYRIRKGTCAIVCFPVGHGLGWVGMVEGEYQSMPRWWNNEGKDTRDRDYDIIED